jgi:hypothetical protein
MRNSFIGIAATLLVAACVAAPSPQDSAAKSTTTPPSVATPPASSIQAAGTPPTPGAQSATGNGAQSGTGKKVVVAKPLLPPEDRRPFGKYLVKVCEVGTGCYDPAQSCKSLSCTAGTAGAPVQPPKPAVAPKNGKAGKNNAAQGQTTPDPGSAAPKCTLCDSTKVQQTITLKQVGCPGTVTLCNAKAKYPLQIGDVFYIQAASDATNPGLVVALPDDADPAGSAVAAGPMVNGVRSYVVTGEGPITIKATQSGDNTRLKAFETSIVLQTADSPSLDCYGLYTAATIATTQPDISAIKDLVGSPVPFVLSTVDPGTILIYATRLPIYKPDEQQILDWIVNTLDGPLGEDAKNSFGVKPKAATPTPFEKELSIPHAAALGDPAARITALGYSKFTVQNMGSTPGKVRISATPAPACKDWKAFLSSVRDLEWSLKSEPSVTKLWYLSSDDAAKGFTSLFAPTGSSPAPGSGSGTPSGSGAPSGAAAPTGGTSSPGAASSNATISVSQPAGSKIEIKTDTTPCVVAGLAFGNSNSCAPSGSGATPAAAAPAGTSPASPTPISASKTISTASIGIPPATPPAGQLPQSPNDMLIYGNPVPGDDAQIAERNRILAQLDLPRPEMIVNAWVMQNSATDPHAMGVFSNRVRTLVERYDQALERMILTAYQTVSGQMRRPDYFNKAFYHYISDRFVAEETQKQTKDSPTAQDFLERSLSRIDDADNADDSKKRTDILGICKRDHYCLGYSWLFQPSKPRLTDLLLALIAAQDPLKEVIETINTVQGTSGGKPAETHTAETRPAEATSTGTKPAAAKTGIQSTIIPPFKCEGLLKHDERYKCQKLQERLSLIGEEKRFNYDYMSSEIDCTTADKWGILRSHFDPIPFASANWSPRIHLACFARAAQQYLQNAGLVRASVAEFLYQYKHSQQYPHEFVAYYLSQSAANLDSVFSPIIDAFNRDVVAFQTYMRADVEYEVEMASRTNDARCCVKRLFGLDKPSFFNDGIVSVRTISGQAAQVSATSQSFLDASKAPSLSDLAAALGGSATGSASPLANVLGNAATQAPVSLLSGVLSSYQKTYAQIGRTLQLQAVPRALATASSAEISVYMKAADPASAPLYTGGPPSALQQNTSEISNFEVTTRIRVDSVKLFELSSYSAVLQRPKSKFPLLPPFVEIPYIGTIAGIPLPDAKEYHESTAIISAMVAPTASDIGFGLRFWDDLVLYDNEPGETGECSLAGEVPVKEDAVTAPDKKPTCRARVALSPLDLHAPLPAYHEAMVLCFSTENAKDGPPPATFTGRLNFVGNRDAPELKGFYDPDTCGNLTFKQFPPPR